MDWLSGVVLGVHLVSMHVPSEPPDNNDNFGAYAKFGNGITLGGYRNTIRRDTYYAGYTWERGPLAVMLGVATGYQRKTSPGETVWAGNPSLLTYFPGPTTGLSRGAVTPMLALSVRLPFDVDGVAPRVTTVPGIMGARTVFNLSLEKAF